MLLDELVNVLHRESVNVYFKLYILRYQLPEIIVVVGTVVVASGIFPKKRSTLITNFTNRIALNRKSCM